MGYRYSLNGTQSNSTYTLLIYFWIHYGAWYVTCAIGGKENDVPNHKDFQPELYKVKKVEQTSNAVYIGMKLHYTDSQQSNLRRLPE